jgi:hypothetical protein
LFSLTTREAITGVIGVSQRTAGKNACSRLHREKIGIGEYPQVLRWDATWSFGLRIRKIDVMEEVGQWPN